jgi:putative flippase GtrA
MEKLLKNHLFFEIIRYLFVGGLSFIGETIILMIANDVLFTFSLIWFNIDIALTLSVTLGFIGGLTINYGLSLKFVFKDYDNPKAKTIQGLIQFTMIGLIGLVMKAILMNILVVVITQPIMLIITMTPLLIAHGITTIIVLAWNYIGRKLIIFKGASV